MAHTFLKIHIGTLKQVFYHFTKFSLSLCNNLLFLQKSNDNIIIDNTYFSYFHAHKQLVIEIDIRKNLFWRKKDRVFRYVKMKEKLL